MLLATTIAGAAAAGGLQLALGTAYGIGDVCDLCSTNYNPVACCSSGGSAYDSNPGGGIDVSAQKAAFDSYCANYKAEQAKKQEAAKPAKPTTPAPQQQAQPAPQQSSQPSASAPQSAPTTQSGSTTYQQTAPAQTDNTAADTAEQSGSDTAATAEPQSTSQNAATSAESSAAKAAEAGKSKDSAAAEAETGDTTDDGATDSSSTSTAAPVGNTTQETSPALRIAAGAVLALAVIGTAIGTVIVRRKRALATTGDDGTGAIDATFNGIAPADGNVTANVATPTAAPVNAWSSASPDASTQDVQATAVLQPADSTGVSASGTITPQSDGGLSSGDVNDTAPTQVIAPQTGDQSGIIR